MTAKESLLVMYKAEIECLRSAYQKEKDTWHDVTRRETLEGAEQAIDSSVAHYAKKLEFANGPKVVKTFK